MSFNGVKSLAFPPRGFSWQWYENFVTSPDWSSSFFNSLKIACLVAILATVLGTLAAFGLDRMRARPANLIRMLLLTPMVVPGVVLAIGIYAVYLDARLVGTLTGFVLAHTILDAMSGWHAADPVALPPPPEPFLAAAQRREKPRRIALAMDLGGVTPVDRSTRAVLRAAADRFAALRGAAGPEHVHARGYGA